MHALLLLDLVALVGGTVHTMEPDSAAQAATVLFRDGRIEAVLAPDVPLPEGARTVDVTGRHVVPGLIDGMVYFDPAHDPLYVAQGVTAIRDLGGDPVRALLEREPAARDRVPGPFLITPGAVIDGDPPSSTEAVILRTPAMADDLLPILFNEKIDFLSVQVGIGPEPFRRAAVLAHDQGLEVWGPVPRALDLPRALELGLDGVLFLDRLLPPGIGWEKVLPGGLKKGIEALEAAGAGVVPVLVATELRLRDQDALDLGLLDPLYAAQWRAELEFRRELLDDDYKKTGARVLAKQQEVLRMIADADIALVAGSAAPQPWLQPGHALHEELLLWERAGLAPYDVLAHATRGNAEALSLADRGTIAAGKVADLVVVADDPRDGVKALRDPLVVVVRGHVLETQRLNDLLAAVRAENDALRAALARPIEVPAPELPEGVVVLRGKVDVHSIGQRIRAERYAVVREPDGALTYVGRTVFRTSEGVSNRQTHVLQRTRDGKLDEFIVELNDGDDSVTSHGLWTASELRIERRANGVLVDTKRVRERVTCVDVGSITSELLLTQLVRTEPFQILTYHELLEPELALWVMGYGGEGGLVHFVRTHKGVITFQSTPLGSVELSRTAVGGGELQTVLVEEDALGGPGLPPPAEKLALVLPAPKPGASTPAEAGAGTPPGAGGDAGDAGGDGSGDDAGDDDAPAPADGDGDGEGDEEPTDG